MQVRIYFVALVSLLFVTIKPACCQQSKDTILHNHKNAKDSVYITRFDTLLHLQSWISAHLLEYKLVYNKDFKLLLSPQQINNLSFGFSYRYLELGLSFSPDFLNTGQDKAEKGKSEQFTFGTGFSIHRFKLNIDLSSVKGFYLKNSKDFLRAAVLPDTPYLVFPDLRV